MLAEADLKTSNESKTNDVEAGKTAARMMLEFGVIS